MKGKTIGIILIVLGFASVITGIVLKRGFGMAQYVFVFHGLAGLLLVVGASMLFLGKGEKN